MTKIDTLRRFLLPCFTSTTVTTNTTTKKRLSTSLRDDIEDPPRKTHENRDGEEEDEEDDSSTVGERIAVARSVAPPRSSKTMVIGTIFGHRRGHVWFCVQHDRLTTRPALLLELPIPTHLLVKEMQCGLVRIALECHDRPDSELGSCPLHSVPVWSMFCNGRKLGFAIRRKTNEANRLMLKTMRSITVGAGVIPAGFSCSSEGDGEVIYMRANYECVVGGPDSESFHLINMDECLGQELSVFLLRSRMLEGRAVVRETDMPEVMQSHVMELAYQALDIHEVSDCQSIAHYIKQKFDEAYGPAWHCVVGQDFGSCITHLCGSFVFFRVEMMEFLVFKDGKDLTQSKEEAIGVLQSV